MDEIAAIAARVAGCQSPECSREVFPLALLPGMGTAPVLIKSYQDDQCDQEETDQCHPVPGIGRKSQGSDEDGADKRFPDRPPESLDRGMSPRGKRRNTHQQHQRCEKGRCGALVERWTNGYLLSGK